MNSLVNHCAGRDAPAMFREGADSTVPVRHGRRRQPPLEVRANWGPWLPATEAYPDVPGPLATLAFFVLAFVAFCVLLLVVAYVF